ncbi:hypothetical protein C8Q74DRAFT_16852 [Fomes fomentarius]|nr:hypothetical protein C8Q74DRAFT_16852 [Fomes fomentarius]
MTVVSLVTYCISVHITIVVYDHITTIGDEVRLFWRRPLSGGAGMYFFIKYVLLFSNLYFLCMLPKGYNSVQLRSGGEIRNWIEHSRAISSRRCSNCSSVPITTILLTPGFSVFMSLRAYALSKSKCLGLLISLLHLVPIGINAAYSPRGITALLDDGHCYLIDDGTNAQRHRCFTDFLDLSRPHWDCGHLACAVDHVPRSWHFPIHSPSTRWNHILLHPPSIELTSSCIVGITDRWFFQGFKIVRLVCILVTRGLMNLQAAYQRTTEWDTDNVLHVIDEGVAVDGDDIQTDESQSTSFALVDRSEP